VAEPLNCFHTIIAIEVVNTWSAYLRLPGYLRTLKQILVKVSVLAFINVRKHSQTSAVILVVAHFISSEAICLYAKSRIFQLFIYSSLRSIFFVSTFSCFHLSTKCFTTINGDPYHLLHYKFRGVTAILHCHICRVFADFHRPGLLLVRPRFGSSFLLLLIVHFINCLFRLSKKLPEVGNSEAQPARKLSLTSEIFHFFKHILQLHIAELTMHDCLSRSILFHKKTRNDCVTREPPQITA